jgi:antitoxin component YwqK of YwqJK toxin-antitoxin module
MKGIKLIVFMLLALSVSFINAQDLNLKMRYEVTEKNGLVYDGSRPFTGTVFEMSGNDVKVLDAQYLNGKRNGRYMEKHSNGKIKFEALYNDGKLADGSHDEFDSSGKKSISKTVRNGIVIKEDHYQLGKISRSVEFRSNGQIEKETPYRNGLKDGEAKRYDDNGRVVEKEVYVQDVLELRTVLEYHGNGSLKVQAEANAIGVKHGVVEEYFASGGLFKKSRYENGSEREILEEHVDPNSTVSKFLKKGSQIYLIDALDGGSQRAYMEVVFDFQNYQAAAQVKDNIMKGLAKRFTAIYDGANEAHRDKAVTHKVIFSNPQATTVYDDGKGSIGGVISTQASPGYRGKATLYCVVEDLKNGKRLIGKNLSGLTNKTSDRNAAQQGAYNAMAWAMDDFSYGFFKVSGKLVSVSETNRGGEATRVEVDLGNAHSLANGFKFNVYTQQGGRKQEIGYLVLQDVLGDVSSRCKVKKGNREIKELMDAGTPIYVEGDYSF